jgi:hypothetical protein
MMFRILHKKYGMIKKYRSKRKIEFYKPKNNNFDHIDPDATDANFAYSFARSQRT